MKLALVLFALAGLVQATPVPIEVFGGGTFVADSPDLLFQFTASFNGASPDGARSVIITAMLCNVSFITNGVGGLCLHPALQGSAMIDGLPFANGFLDISLGYNATVTGYDAQHQPSVTESINGIPTITAMNCPLPNACDGSFAIAPIPEPGALLLTLAGLGLVAIMMARTRGRAEREKRADTLRPRLDPAQSPRP